MPHRWDPIAPAVSGLVLPVRVGKGGPTPKQARGPGWRTTSPGRFVPSAVDPTIVEQRIVEASARGGVVTGWAGLRLHGGGFFDGLARDGRSPLPVPLAANGSRLRSGYGTSVTEDRIPPDEVVTVHGIRCATIHRSLYDELQRIGEIREMAVAVGAACAARMTTVERMRIYVATRRWSRDVRTVTTALEMAVDGCRSPQEDRFRIVWEYDAGWGRPLLNRTVLDRHGAFVAVPDLLDPARGVVGEYAGADHRDIDQHEADIAREAALRDVGLEYVEVVGRDLRDPARVVKRMQAAAARAVHLERHWQLAPVETPRLALPDRI